MDKVKVIFRKDKEGNIIAFLPELRVNRGNIMSYMHIGQHGEASYQFYAETKRADESEYNSLLDELKRIYDDCTLVVKQKLYYDDLVNKAWQWKNRSFGKMNDQMENNNWKQYYSKGGHLFYGKEKRKQLHNWWREQNS